MRDLVPELQAVMETLDDLDLLHSSEIVRAARDEIAQLREALMPFAAILANGEPVGPIPRGYLDSKLTRDQLRRATTLLGLNTSRSKFGILR